jgi:2-polyprenyl-3-methyl-5-hydroxy-6-metoxy-1,4-benzoquinol methylase
MKGIDESAARRCAACFGELRFFGRRNDYDYFQCEHCQTVQLSPFPSSEQLEKAYEHDYGESGHYVAPGVVLRESEPYFKALADLLDQLSPTGQLLDLGCGCGGLSRKLAAKGRDYLAVDLSVPAVEFCKASGLNVRNASIETLLNEQVRFSGIGMNAVFEHFTEPERNLRALRELLVPGGVIVNSFVTAPFPTFCAKWWMRLNGRKDLPALRKIFWPPWHVAFYTLTGMRTLSARCKLSVERVVPATIPVLPGLIGLVRPAFAAASTIGFHVFGETWPLATSHIFCLRRIE